MAGLRESINPNSLYILCIRVVADNFKFLRNDLNCLPANIMFDVHYKLYKENSLCSLGDEFGNLEVFTRILKLTICRPTLHRCFQALEEHGAGVAKALSNTYVINARKCISIPCIITKQNVVDTGLRLGGFLSDAAWYDKAEKVLLACKELCESLNPSLSNKRLLLHCCHKLLRVQAFYCNVTGAQETYEQNLSLIKDLKESDSAPNLSAIYADFSVYFFVKSEFDDSYRYSMEALKELTPSVPPKTTLDVLRQASKACVVKREFTKAGILIRQAIDLAAAVFGVEHPKYADAQLDYGFYLLNFDSIPQAVEVYESAYRIKQSVFGTNNIHVAVALEDLGYALYVNEYSTGLFDVAKNRTEKAITIMEKLLPCDHIMLSSAKRVKALILEEIAIDHPEDISDRQLLADAEELHLIALNLAKRAFGEKNVQTAKHYGNLGRLYQSMKKFSEAESMHLKAIAIKEELLGPNDYEVGLSIGHLASLYNYHMKQFLKALDLYLRSIDINTKLFGKGYSGLEYDYRGLVHVFTELADPEKAAEYSYLLNSWKVLREHQLQRNNETVMLHQPPKPILEVVQQVLDKNPNQPCSSAS